MEDYYGQENRESLDSEMPDHDKDVFGEMNTDEAEEENAKQYAKKLGGKLQALNQEVPNRYDVKDLEHYGQP